MLSLIGFLEKEFGATTGSGPFSDLPDREMKAVSGHFFAFGNVVVAQFAENVMTSERVYRTP
jgi:hypothetical protein